ncbi:MAG: hypothetical protein WCF85_00495 [Rhodospirillaceae bacterium]
MATAKIEYAGVSRVANQNFFDTVNPDRMIRQTLRSGIDYIKKIYRSTGLMRIRYDESFTVGLSELDARRQIVVGVYNALNYELRLIAEQAGSMTRLNERASLLVKLIGELFAFEETLMIETEFSRYALHKAKHTRFLVSLHKEFEGIQKGGADMYDLSYLIGSWLTEHMRGVDKLFGDFVVQRSGEITISED